MIVAGERGRLLASETSSFKSGTASKANLVVEVDGHQAYKGQDVTYPPVIERSGHHGATFFEHEALIDQLEGKQTDCATPLQGLKAIIIASAAQEAIATRRLIDIDEYIERNNLTQSLNESSI